MSMTKKDYELIAQVIRDRFENSQLLDRLNFTVKEVEATEATITDLAYYMSSRLAQDNPNFDRKRFLEACGIE